MPGRIAQIGGQRDCGAGFHVKGRPQRCKRTVLYGLLPHPEHIFRVLGKAGELDVAAAVGRRGNFCGRPICARRDQLHIVVQQRDVLHGDGVRGVFDVRPFHRGPRGNGDVRRCACGRAGGAWVDLSKPNRRHIMFYAVRPFIIDAGNRNRVPVCATVGSVGRYTTNAQAFQRIIRRLHGIQGLFLVVDLHIRRRCNVEVHPSGKIDSFVPAPQPEVDTAIGIG